MWSPGTAAELSAAIDEGALPHESAASDVKAQLPESRRSGDIAVESQVVQRMINLDPNKLTPNELAHWAEISVRIERMARGATDGSTPEIRQPVPEPQHETLVAQRIVQDPKLRAPSLELLRKAHGRKPAHLRAVGDAEDQQSD
jgi:hypothetical protein